MRWQKKLTKKELQHVKETTFGGTLGSFKRNREGHRAEVAAGKPEPCFECRAIAIKLGIEQ